MRRAPVPGLRISLRILAKAAILVLIGNALCLWAGIDPATALMQLNTWPLVGQGRPRLAYPSDFANGQLPLEALLAAHTIAQTPKAADEYRVVVLGESGIAGYGLTDAETFTAQWTARGQRVDGKRLVAYNLAYPSPNAARDVLILDAALRYQPDLIVWFVTAVALDDDPDAPGTNRAFFSLNRDRLTRLASAFGLESWLATRLPPLSPPRSWFAVRSGSAIPAWLNSLFYPFIAPDLGLSPRRISREPLPERARYPSESPGFRQMPNDSWRWLDAGAALAGRQGVDLLLVNGPMFIGSGPNSDVNYNSTYARDLYDRYRAALAPYAAALNLRYLDAWDAIPPENFRDTPLHADAAGYGLLADLLADQVAALERGVP